MTFALRPYQQASCDAAYANGVKVAKDRNGEIIQDMR